MPKLVTVLGVLVLALSAGPTLAQDATAPPAAKGTAAEDSEASAADEETPAAAAEGESDAAPTDAAAGDAAAGDAAAGDAAADDAAAGDAAAADAGDDAAPADTTVAPSTQPAGPSTQPAGPSTQPAGDVDDAADAGEGAAAASTGAAPPIALSADQPNVSERRLVAYVSTGVAAVALGTGITLGTLALMQYDCLADIQQCNASAEEPILGEAFLDKKAEVETLSLLADMAYVVAAAATIVAVTGYIRGYFLTDEEPAAEVTP